jgi:hypothetical protein
MQAEMNKYRTRLDGLPEELKLSKKRMSLVKQQVRQLEELSRYLVDSFSQDILLDILIDLHTMMDNMASARIASLEKEEIRQECADRVSLRGPIHDIGRDILNRKYETTKKEKK